MGLQAKAHVKAHQADEHVDSDGNQDGFAGGDFLGQLGKQDGAGHGHNLGDQQRQDHARRAQAQGGAVGRGDADDRAHAVNVEEVGDDEHQHAPALGDVAHGVEHIGKGGLQRNLFGFFDIVHLLNIFEEGDGEDQPPH